MARVLLLSPFFFPEPISTGRYNSLLVSGMVERGHEVSVVCSHPLYPSWKPTFSDRSPAGVRVIRGGEWMRYSANPILRRAALELWFTAHALKWSWKLRREVDILLAIFPPSFFFLFVAKLFPGKTRKVGIVHDLQGVHAQAGKARYSRIIGRVISRVEKLGFKFCDRLIVLSDAMRRELVSDGISADQVVVRYPFINLPPASGAMDRLASLFEEGYVHITYSGALGVKQNPGSLAPIIERIVKDNRSVQVSFFSEGAAFEALKAECQQLRLERVHFHPLVDEEDVAELYQRADIQILPQADGTQHGSMPSKLPNILISGRPVLAICAADSDLAEVIKNLDAGVCVHSWEPASVSAAVVSLLARQNNAGNEVAQKRLDQMRASFSLEHLIESIEQ